MSNFWDSLCLKQMENLVTLNLFLKYQIKFGYSQCYF